MEAFCTTTQIPEGEITMGTLSAVQGLVTLEQLCRTSQGLRPVPTNLGDV